MKKTRTTYNPTPAELRAIEKGRQSPSTTLGEFFADVERLAVKKSGAKGKSTALPRKKGSTVRMNKAEIDKRLAEGLDDIKKGRMYGPFRSAAAAVHLLKQQRRARPAGTPPRTSFRIRSK